jgi:hypothetical protein
LESVQVESHKRIQEFYDILLSSTENLKENSFIETPFLHLHIMDDYLDSQFGLASPLSGGRSGPIDFVGTRAVALSFSVFLKKLARNLKRKSIHESYS